MVAEETFIEARQLHQALLRWGEAGASSFGSAVLAKFSNVGSICADGPLQRKIETIRLREPLTTTSSEVLWFSAFAGENAASSPPAARATTRLDAAAGAGAVGAAVELPGEMAPGFDVRGGERVLVSGDEVAVVADLGVDARQVAEAILVWQLWMEGKSQMKPAA